MADTPLKAKLIERIRKSGPITIADYMAVCLADPEHGYYTTRDPFGRAGDFTTAPEISQMFGEMLGLWAAVIWQQMGCPERIALVEIGPGRGTLMADALRAASQVPLFRQAIQVHLVETSPVLRRKQAEAVGSASPRWHNRLDSVPDGPAIIIANEFIDALPIRQLIRSVDGWRERLVTVDEETGDLAYGATPSPALAEALVYPPLRRHAKAGDIAEICPAGLTVAKDLGRRAQQDGSVALLIDYGHPVTAIGDTLQALGGHRPVHPLAAPGETDLTAHVDFDALGRAARESGAAVHGPKTQGAFLTDLGIEARAAVLARNAEDPDSIAKDLKRLVDPDQMGRLFSAMAIAPASGALPPGFETRG
ncbi:MAG: SAM-dependent methyltransferase [Alphaproteobacteria bacterium]|nr:SAM-dependent methyltransferase [Alphaproteobacteria bacterium]